MVKKIPLTQGQYALVDDEDYECINQFKWSFESRKNTNYAITTKNTGYVNGKQKTRTLRMHRVVLPAKKGQQIDHIDGNGLNNCKFNLRIVTNRQNQQNRHLSYSSQYPGVYLTKSKKWASKIAVNGINKHIGCFNTEKEAFEAYKEAVKELAHEKTLCEDLGGNKEKTGGIV